MGLTPDFQTEAVSLYRGDCLDVMPGLEAGSVDLILADLPYGVTACKWDVVIPFEPLWECYKRLLKPKGVVVLTATQPFGAMAIMSNPKWFRCEWIWEKQKASNFQQANIKPMKVHESALVFSAQLGTYNPQKTDLGTSYTYKGSPRKSPSYLRMGSSAGEGMRPGGTYIGKFPRSVIKFSNESGNPGTHVHVSRKALLLFEYLIKTYSNPGETVLDNVVGSGTTAVACLNTGRRCIGVERDATYFDIAVNRIEQALKTQVSAASHPRRAEPSQPARKRDDPRQLTLI